MKVLTLPLNGIYFDQIKSGEKVEEFRLMTPYWIKRLQFRIYDHMILTRGYPKRDDTERRLYRPWEGYRTATITHDHFGPDPVNVFAIKVN